MEKFSCVNADNIKENVFKLIGNDWMLVTAGNKDSFNTMTASWGGVGILWHKQVSFCFIRPSRYTYSFMEKSDYYTLSFFEEEYRDVLNFCGSKSGRDVDKVEKTGITPVQDDSGSMYFSEAKMVLVCRKLYFRDFAPEQILDPEVKKIYQSGDCHRMYIGEIEKCLIK